MKKILSTLKSKRGESTISTIVILLIFLMMMILTLNVYSFFVIHQDMDAFAQGMIESVSVHGTTSGINERYSTLSAQTGLSPTYDWVGTDFISGTDKIQYGDEIMITMHLESRIGIGDIGIPVSISLSHSGISHMYFK